MFGNNKTGWKPQPAATELYASTIPAKYKTQLDALPFDLDKSAFPFRALTQVLRGSQHVTAGRLNALNQGSYGSCTGFAGSRAADITAACDILWRQEAEKWPRNGDGQPVITAPDYCYGASRDVSGNLGRYQGSYGAAVAKALRLYGAIHQTKYGRFDLSTYSIDKCKKWAAVGIPEPLKEEALKHQFLTTVRIENVEQAIALTQNGYGFMICCGLGWHTKRDDDGFARRVRPGWSHAQVGGLGYVVIKKNRKTRRGVLLQNSWGNRWQSGGLFCDDQPRGAYFIELDDLQTALESGDCFAVADFEGFTERYDWSRLGW